MALRKIDCIILKNSNIVNRPLPSTLLGGEAIVNTAQGIVFFSGVTSSTNEWTPAGVGAAANFWEVGSNLYDLRLRNRITQYEGISGAGLVGKFLSGTTSGFTLADISQIGSITSFNYLNNTFTITQSNGGIFNATFNTVTGLTVNGILSATTANIGTSNINTLNATGGTINTLSSTTITGTNFFINGGIQTYSGLTNLSNQFLSGTTNGFVLAPISAITGVDTYTTAFTYSNNVATIYQNIGQPPLSILINTMTGLTINGVLSASTANLGIANINALNATAATINTLNSTNIVTTNLTATTETVTTVNGTNINVSNLQASAGTITTLNSTNINTNNFTATTGTINSLSATTLTVSGTTNLNGPSFYNKVVSGTNINEIVNVGFLTSFTQTTDVYVTGATYVGATNNTNNTTFNLLYHGVPLNGPYSLTAKDTYITGTTWTPNILTSRRNDGVVISTLIDTFSALTVTSGLSLTYLTPGRVVFVGTGGTLTDDAGFTYNSVTNTLSTPTDGSMIVGTGGLVVGSGGSPSVAGTGDVIINGNLTVFGAAISAFTSQLYVEDSNVIFNYSPTGCTIATSICAGLTIQDGNGVCGGDVGFDIRPMNAFTGTTGCPNPDISEYTGPTGYNNRAWVTQLHDIVIRSNNNSCTAPNGVRVLAECDCLDAGTY